MKNITPKLIRLFKENYCTPNIIKIARKLKEPSTTIHYNIKKLEKEGKIKTYKAVFDYKKIDQEFCAYALVDLSPSECDCDKMAKELSKYPEIESIDICTGDWELVIKIRTKNQEEYYNLIKKVAREGVNKIKTLTSLKQLKTEFVEL